MKLRALALASSLLACTTEAREDAKAAGEALERSGEELGEAAQKTVDRAEVAGKQLSAELDDARGQLARAKEAADLAGDLYKDPGQGERIAQEAVWCSEERYAIGRAMAQRASENPMAVAGNTSFEPVAGKGYRLTRVDPASPVARLDVRVGDIVTAVDGTAIDSLDGANLVRRLQHASEITFTVERHGQNVTKTVTIES